ncbi:MAG TPA: hypothetical protein VMS93_12985 [Candidatus Saccharimonadales bacterium]|nr:hypothetical protein [Candidatus Saccharimonadales bacterium]
MRQRLAWAPAETLPPRAEVLRLQGLPRGTEPAPRIGALLDAAVAAYLEAAEPRALVGEIEAPAFAKVYRGEGRNAPATPLAGIFPRAERLALFVATVGGAVTARIRAGFDGNQPAFAAMLDSVASAAADRLTLLLGERALAEGAAGGGLRVLGYSPGYCGWHVSGQRALFGFLAPEEIGVRLNPSCLMDPLKSVSGVLVVGPPDIHRFAPKYPFCAECRDRPCLGRIAALSRP